jgi:hypothetical protein
MVYLQRKSSRLLIFLTWKPLEEVWFTIEVNRQHCILCQIWAERLQK